MPEQSILYLGLCLRKTRNNNPICFLEISTTSLTILTYTKMTTASIRPTDAAVIAGVVKGSVASCQNSFGRYNLNALVRDIKQYLEGRDEITMELHESTYLTSLMQKYASDPSDWTSYFHNDPSKAYTRNTISNISHKANIVSKPRYLL